MSRQNNQARLARDVHDLMRCWDEENMYNFNVAVAGPNVSPFAGGTFELRFHVPHRFPFSAPNVKFLTPVFHPNIHYDGAICVDTLSEWCPATTLLEVSECIQSLLASPNSRSPLNIDASILMEDDIDMYNDTVKMWTSVHAGGTCRPPTLQEKLKQVLEVATGWSEDKALQKLSENKWDVANALVSRRI